MIVVSGERFYRLSSCILERFQLYSLELNKWTLPGLQKHRTMAKCIASETEHRALSKIKKETVLHLPRIEWSDGQSEWNN
ncbi:hypothetical protein AVEN_218809-1 [Araneus ventricosus]|uniref:Uncharacterized protein n=1 Tax=Araneus ventricosus TaxID=182803 RepID=A0A4Y2B755_ARAVE|nr:hypothetical protein AVEN_218809-1 [Araneus ventricosus]